MTFKNIIDEAFNPEFEKWVATKLQTATNEKNQIDLANLQALQKEIAAQKATQQQTQQQQFQQTNQKTAQQQTPQQTPTAAV